MSRESPEEQRLLLSSLLVLSARSDCWVCPLSGGYNQVDLFSVVLLNPLRAIGNTAHISSDSHPPTVQCVLFPWVSYLYLTQQRVVVEVLHFCVCGVYAHVCMGVCAQSQEDDIRISLRRDLFLKLEFTFFQLVWQPTAPAFLSPCPQASAVVARAYRAMPGLFTWVLGPKLWLYNKPSESLSCAFRDC